MVGWQWFAGLQKIGYVGGVGVNWNHDGGDDEDEGDGDDEGEDDDNEDDNNEEQSYGYLNFHPKLSTISRKDTIKIL